MAIGFTLKRDYLIRTHLKHIGGYNMSNLYYPIESYVHKRAKRTGEYREPKKGEYYISGAIPKAYLAYNDLSEKYYIARPVRTKMIEIEE